MRGMGFLAGAVALLIAGGARCQGRDGGAAGKALQPVHCKSARDSLKSGKAISPITRRHTALDHEHDDPR